MIPYPPFFRFLFTLIGPSSCAFNTPDDLARLAFRLQQPLEFLLVPFSSNISCLVPEAFLNRTSCPLRLSSEGENCLGCGGEGGALFFLGVGGGGGGVRGVGGCLFSSLPLVVGGVLGGFLRLGVCFLFFFFFLGGAVCGGWVGLRVSRGDPASG